MADRTANHEGVVTRLVLFARSLCLLALLAVGLPWVLVFAARERFGGGAPFHGVPSPADWSATRIRTALMERLTEQTIADIVIRLAVVVAWVGVTVIVVTVVAEVVHMVRHDGLAMPDIRGFGFTQRTARVIAAGLLVIVPLFTSPTPTRANPTTSVLAERGVASALHAERTGSAPEPSVGPRAAFDESRAVTPANGDHVQHDSETPATVAPDASSPTGDYVVQPGDSIYGIAERMVGPDSTRVATFAERLVDANLGRRMPDGRHFTNAAFIDVGWVLELPDGAAPTSDANRDPAGVHVVESGESLWSIAEDELGDPARWPEVYGANEGRTFDDGRSLDDPDLIQPGWALRLPDQPPVAAAVEAESSVPDSGDVESLAENTVPTAPGDEVAVLDTTVGSIDPDGPVNADVNADLGPLRADALSDAPAVAPARRDNVWDEVGVDATGPATPANSGSDARADGEESESSAPRLLPLGAAAMLSAGVLTLLAVRRRTQLRRARPRASLSAPSTGPAATERALRAIDVGERFARVETAIRAVAMPLVDRGERVLAAFVGPEGGLELRTTGSVVLPAPWEGDGSVWHLAASTPLELLADDARSVGPPCPTLVQLGTDDDGRDVYVDLEAAEAIEVGGPGVHADAIVAAIAATLAGSLLAEVTTLVGLGVADEAFLGHRRYVPVSDGQRAFEASSAAIGSTGSAGTPTFELRATGTATETWEPAVVLIGASAGTVTVPNERTGLAVVSASPIHGPSSRLAPDGDTWALQPSGIRLTPVGLAADDIAALSELVTVVDPEPAVAPEPRVDPEARFDAASEPEPTHDVSLRLDHAGLDDHTIIAGPHDYLDGPPDGQDRPGEPEQPDLIDDVNDDLIDEGPVGDVDGESSTVVAPPPPSHGLLVRMIGPVGVVDREGNEVAFERSKTRELVAWLATHRERSTRSAARTALWELDVRDATFANVVSEARRSLARLVEPPEGDEWVGRTMTDALPLHDLVLSDVDLLRHALDAARLQPPTQAVATLAPAVSLIAGIPFEGTSYLWPDSEGITSNFVLLATTATTELAAHCLSIGDIEGVFSATARGLQVLPGHEELIGLRMEAHARAGDHAGVRQEWESYERVINGDPWSDGEPAPKLVELRRRLLNPTR